MCFPSFGSVKGDEEVRKEYWQELKETLAREDRSILGYRRSRPRILEELSGVLGFRMREEVQVRQQNGRLADQQLSDALKRWQDGSSIII